MSPDFAHLIARSWDAYHDGEAEVGRSLAAQAVQLKPKDGRGHYVLACNLERLGQLMAADRSFSRAAGATHEPHPLPYRVSWRHFESAVSRGADDLPLELREALEEVQLVLADYAGAEQAGQDRSYELLGLFAGPMKSEREEHAGSGELTPRIYLYRRAHEHIATSSIEFDEEVKRTLYHELGHYLGFDEDDMERFGLE